MSSMTVDRFEFLIQYSDYQRNVLLNMLDYYDTEACAVLAAKIRQHGRQNTPRVAAMLDPNYLVFLCPNCRIDTHVFMLPAAFSGPAALVRCPMCWWPLEMGRTQVIPPAYSVDLAVYIPAIATRRGGDALPPMTVDRRIRRAPAPNGSTAPALETHLP